MKYLESGCLFETYSLIIHQSLSLPKHKYHATLKLIQHPSFVCSRYLDSVTNKDSPLPPIPHLHSLLTDNGEPHPEVDIFKLVRSSYEVFNLDDNVCFVHVVCCLFFCFFFLFEA